MTVRKAHGFALIDMIFVCGILGILASVAMPRLLLAKSAAGASSAVASMRAIGSAQLTYALTCGSGFYAPNLSTLGTAPPGSTAPFIGGGLGAANTVTKASYIIQMSATPFAGSPASCNGAAAGDGGQGFKAAADPNAAGNTRFFAINANNVIFEDVSTLFAIMPEAGQPASGHILQ